MLLALTWAGLTFVATLATGADSLGFTAAFYLSLLTPIPAWIFLEQQRRKAAAAGSELDILKQPLLTASRAGVALAIPFSFLMVGTLRRGSCDFLQDVAWFFLLVGIGWLCNATLLEAMRLQGWRRRQIALGYGLLLLLTLAANLLRLATGVDFSLHNTFFGFFPGPIYDEQLPLTARLVFFRLLTVGWVGWSTWAWLHRSRGWGRRGVPAGAIGLLLALHLGWGTPRLSLQRYLSLKATTDRVELFADPILSADGFDVAALVNDADYLVQQLRVTLQVPVTRRIRIYLFADAWQKKRLTGTADTLIGNPMHRELFLLPTQFPDSVLRHELAHVVAAEVGIPLLKTGRSIGWTEGLAVALEQRPNLQLQAKVLAAAGRERSAAAVMHGFGFLQLPPAHAYILAGSFVDFLSKRCGWPAVAKIYRGGDYQKACAGSLTSLDQEWQQSLKKEPPTQEQQLAYAETVRQQPVGQRRCVQAAAFCSHLAQAAYSHNQPPQLLQFSQRAYRLAGGNYESQVALTAALLRNIAGPAGQQQAARLAAAWLRRPATWVAAQRLKVAAWLSAGQVWKAWAWVERLQQGNTALLTLKDRANFSLVRQFLENGDPMAAVRAVGDDLFVGAWTMPFPKMLSADGQRSDLPRTYGWSPRGRAQLALWQGVLAFRRGAWPESRRFFSAAAEGGVASAAIWQERLAAATAEAAR